MFFQPAIIALLFSAGLALLLLLVAAPFAFEVIRHWDLQSGSERQLILERRTYLFSTLLAFVLLLQLAALLLFVFNADRLSVMFVGAMCAVGTLNVNAWGFPSLFGHVAVFFLAAVWLVINHVDVQARDYPLVRTKFGLMLGLLPVLALNAWLEFRYFQGLRANVITSCCGSLFSPDSQAIAAEVSALSPRQGMALFYGGLLAAIAISGWHWRDRGRLSGWLAGLAGVGGFSVAMVGVLSFVSLYIYEHPNHHCPFCILKPEYDYQGYALYLPLFLATAASLGCAVLQFFAGRPSLHLIIPRVSSRLAGLAAAGYAVFVLLATAVVLSSNLILIEH